MQCPSVRGSLRGCAESFECQLQPGFLLSAYQSRIQTAMEENLDRLLAGGGVMALNGFFGHRPLIAVVKKSGANPENRGQILISYAPNFER